MFLVARMRLLLSPDLAETVPRHILAIGRTAARCLEGAAGTVTPAAATELDQLREESFDLLCSIERPPRPEHASIAAWARLVRPGGLVRVVQPGPPLRPRNSVTLLAAQFLHAGLTDVEQHQRAGLIATSGRRPPTSPPDSNVQPGTL